MTLTVYFKHQTLSFITAVQRYAFIKWLVSMAFLFRKNLKKVWEKNLSWRTDRRMGSNWGRLTTEPAMLMVVMGENVRRQDKSKRLSRFDKIRNFLSPAILISNNCIRPSPSPSLKQPVPSLPLLSTLNLTTVTLSTTIFLSLKWTDSSRFRTVLHVL